MIEVSDIEEYLRVSANRTKRVDHRYKFVLYARPDEFEQVVKAVKDAGLEEVAETIKPANTNKSMRYLQEPGTDEGGRFLDR